MRSEHSPFPCHWWGIDLENVGLETVRPRTGTYGRYDFRRLPPLPFELHSDFQWLATAPSHGWHIGVERAAENPPALLALRASSRRIGLRLPVSFERFLQDPSLHEHVRSNTDCYLDICPALVSSPIGNGHLIRFLSDSQGCQFWYLYLTRDGSDHAVVSSPGFYGTQEERWQDYEPDSGELAFCAESFETFVCRFWLENEIWFAAFEGAPMLAAGVQYIKQYLETP